MRKAQHKIIIIYLFEHKRFVTVHRVDTIVRYDTGAELLPDRVSRKSVHLHVHVSARPFVGEHLTGNDVHGQCAGYYPVHGRLGERVKSSVCAPHELWL